MNHHQLGKCLKVNLTKRTNVDDENHFITLYIVKDYVSELVGYYYPAPWTVRAAMQHQSAVPNNCQGGILGS